MLIIDASLSKLNFTFLVPLPPLVQWTPCYLVPLDPWAHLHTERWLIAPSPHFTNSNQSKCYKVGLLVIKVSRLSCSMSLYSLSHREQPLTWLQRRQQQIHVHKNQYPENRRLNQLSLFWLFPLIDKTTDKQKNLKCRLISKRYQKNLKLKLVPLWTFVHLLTTMHSRKLKVIGLLESQIKINFCG